MEDAIVLKSALDQNPSVPKALVAYEQERRPAVEKLQAAAETSRIWFEKMAEKMGPVPHLFAHDCMTRSGRVDLEKLRAQDPVFVADYEEALAANS